MVRFTEVDSTPTEVVTAMPPQRKDPAPVLHVCPACGRPQTKIQRLVGTATRGSTTYVCTRAGECSVGVSLSKIANWVAV